MQIKPHRIQQFRCALHHLHLHENSSPCSPQARKVITHSTVISYLGLLVGRLDGLIEGFLLEEGLLLGAMGL